MGDIIALLNGLNLSPVNTLLLGAVLYFIRELFKEIWYLKRRHGSHRVRLAVIESHLDIKREQTDDEGDD